LSREDDDPWAVVSRRTGGVTWTASTDARAADGAAARSAFAEWVRPQRIDRVTYASPALSPRVRRELALPDTLQAGEGIETSEEIVFSPKFKLKALGRISLGVGAVT
jgi:hypothetical protein